MAYIPKKPERLRRPFETEPESEGPVSHAHNVENDAFDRAMFAEMLEDSPVLQGLIERGGTVFTPFPALLQDIFSSLYKYNIKLNERDSMVRSNLQNRSYVEQILNRPEYQSLRRFTILNEPAAAIGATSLAQNVLSEIEKRIAEDANELAEQEQGLADAQEELEALQDLLERMQDQPLEDEIRERLEQAQQQFDQAQAEYDEQAEEFDESSQDLQDMVERSIEQGYEQALEDLQENMQLMEGFGDEAGATQRMSVNQRLMLAKKLRGSDKLKKLAKMVGKFKRLALAQQKKREQDQYEEMYDVMMGNEISRLIPTELMALKHPVLRKDFKRRYLEKKLLQYNIRGEDEKGKGALVVCIDGSYSMEGEKELWSKAVTLALLDIATRQKRDFRAIHFGSKKDPLKLMEFPKGERTEDRLERIELLAEYFIGGGTDFEKPLQAAVHSLEEDSKQRGDIVFITDGDCVVSPRWLAEFKRAKERMEISVFSILVDMGINTPATVREFSDKVTSVSRLTSEEVKDIFASL